MILDDIVERLDSADISPNVYRTAIRLLRRTHPDNGYARLSYEQFAEICGTASEATCRRHLADLAAADLITYRRNSAVHVHWHDWPTIADGDPMIYDNPARATRAKSSTTRAKSTTERAQDEERNLTETGSARATRAKSSTTRAKSTTERAGPIHAHAGALVGWLVDPLSNTESDQSTNHGSPDVDERPISEPTPIPDEAERARTFALLVDPALHVGATKANQLAAEHTFDECRRIVAMFWDRLQSGAVGSGKVITAIDAKWGAPPISDSFRLTDFYRRHRTPDEVAAEQAALDEEQRLAEEPEEEPPEPGPDLQCEPEEGTPAWAWEQVKRELAIEQGGSFDRWLTGTYVLIFNEETNAFGIVLPDSMRADWVRNRLSKQIVRKLSVITRRPALVEFIIPESVSRETQAQGDST